MNYFLFEADELELNLVFTEEELEAFKEQWSGNVDLKDIAKNMRRKPSEIALLVFDHAERNLINKRHRGIFGA